MMPIFGLRPPERTMRLRLLARTKASMASRLKSWSRASWSSTPSRLRMLRPPGGIVKSSGMTIFTRSSRPSTEAVDSMLSFTHLNAPRCREAAHGVAVEAVIEDLLNARRIQDRDHHVDEVEFGLVRDGGGFGRVVVAHQRQHAAVFGGAAMLAWRNTSPERSTPGPCRTRGRTRRHICRRRGSRPAASPRRRSRQVPR